MNPLTSEQDAHFISPEKSFSAFFLSSSLFEISARLHIAARYNPVNFAPFSIGVHQER